jgi:hypothetical protein
MTLPNEIILKILTYLPAADICTISQTCQYLKSVSETEWLWQVLCEPITSHSPFPSWRELYKWRLRFAGDLQGLWNNQRNPYTPSTNPNSAVPCANLAGELTHCQYNQVTGNFDFHVFCIHIYAHIL